MVNPYIEKRKFGRRAVFKPAVIVTDDGRKIAGSVIDISEGGARFQTADPTLIPRVFMLEIAVDDFCVRSEVVHRLAEAVGIKFIASPRKISWGPAGRRYFPNARDQGD